mmetsp:Transcript_1876/g.3593  ORF Transcript_1876/g.3593 Transcript_1876/m.3593 type:complete len:201 (+) Transcript_1876:365-967(+)
MRYWRWAQHHIQCPRQAPSFSGADCDNTVHRVWKMRTHLDSALVDANAALRGFSTPDNLHDVHGALRTIGALCEEAAQLLIRDCRQWALDFMKATYHTQPWMRALGHGQEGVSTLSTPPSLHIHVLHPESEAYHRELPEWSFLVRKVAALNPAPDGENDRQPLALSANQRQLRENKRRILTLQQVRPNLQAVVQRTVTFP